MSPEANSEQGQDQATKSKFDTSVHPEGVREFGKHGDLSEMARITEDGELKTNISIPAHPGDIDPHTHEVEVTKVAPLDATPDTQVIPEAPVKAPIHEAPANTPWYTKTGAKIAGAALVVTTVLAGGAAVMGGDDKATEPRDTEPTASAPASPGGEAKPDNEPVSIVGIETRPSTEQLRLAEAPVTNRDFPTIKEAYPALLERLNVYTTGADMDFSTVPVVETPESIASGEKLLDAVYGPNHEARAGFDSSAAETMRNKVGLKFYYLYEIQEKEATFRYDSEVTSIEKTTVPGATEAYTVHSILSTTSNIPELDPTEHNFDPLVSNTYEQESTVALSPDGNWYFEHIHNLE